MGRKPKEAGETIICSFESTELDTQYKADVDDISGITNGVTQYLNLLVYNKELSKPLTVEAIRLLKKKIGTSSDMKELFYKKKKVIREEKRILLRSTE